MKSLFFMTLLTAMFSSSVMSQATYTYLALGDSYTIGEDEVFDRIFPKILYDHLAKTKMTTHIAVAQKIIAKTGWTTHDLITAMNQQLPEDSDYDLVTVLIGVNNQYQGKPISQYEKEFETIIQRAVKLAKNKSQNVIVVSIPDYGVTPFAAQKNPEKIKNEINQYNSINEAFANKYNTQYVNITPESRFAATDISLLAKDKLHPSGKMYQQWVDKIIKVLP